MQVTAVSHSKERKESDVIVVPVWNHKKKPTIACEAKEFVSLAQFPFKSGDFSGKEGETLLLYSHRGKEKRVLLLGLGEKNTSTPSGIRKAYGSAVKVIRAKKMKRGNFLIPETDLMSRQAICTAATEGVLLANYAFDYKKEPSSCLNKICFCGLNRKEHEELKWTERLVSSVNFVRDLVNANADDIHVDTLKKIAKDLEKEFSTVQTTILDKKALEKEKMGLLLAVGRGAMRDPALILLEYRGNPDSKEKIAVVGKGVTYDTGGLNIKVSGMETMKCDMAGAAVALGIMRAAADLKLKVNLVSALAVAENAVGPTSFKPGDVYKSYLGKTVEIANTDAEGRLILADAVAYVEKKYAPKTLIDFATLTGGVVVALGEEATGLFSTSDSLAKALEEAGERTHERVWRLPLFPEYKEYLKSSIADLKNLGPRKASSSTGAMFIQQFIKEAAWAHLDIAGTAYLSELKPNDPTPATGVGIRLLVDFFEHLNRPLAKSTEAWLCKGSNE